MRATQIRCGPCNALASCLGVLDRLSAIPAQGCGLLRWLSFLHASHAVANVKILVSGLWWQIGTNVESDIDPMRTIQCIGSMPWGIRKTIRYTSTRIGIIEVVAIPSKQP